ncbi:MAG: TVP38/TMEM64 family protein [Bacilli bacterium]
MKKYAFIIIITLWSIIFFIAYQAGFTKVQPQDLYSLIINNPMYLSVTFLCLYSVRIFFLIPSSMLIVVGSFLFDPIKSVVLCFIGVLITQSLLYVFALSFKSSKWHQIVMDKRPNVVNYIQQNHARMLFLLIALPTAPTDFACFAAASTGMRYRDYMVSVMLGIIPVLTIYTLFGTFLLKHTALTLLLSVGFMGAVYVYISRSPSLQGFRNALKQ